LSIDDIDAQIPELRDGFEDLVSFADFCNFLVDDEVSFEAQRLIESARALLGATTANLMGRTGVPV
jgi:hypothetical protein